MRGGDETFVPRKSGPLKAFAGSRAVDSDDAQTISIRRDLVCRQRGLKPPGALANCLMWLLEVGRVNVLRSGTHDRTNAGRQFRTMALNCAQ